MQYPAPLEQRRDSKPPTKATARLLYPSLFSFWGFWHERGTEGVSEVLLLSRLLPLNSISTESVGSAFPHILNKQTDTTFPPEMNAVVRVVLSFGTQLGGSH